MGLVILKPSSREEYPSRLLTTQRCVRGLARPKAIVMSSTASAYLRGIPEYHAFACGV